MDEPATEEIDAEVHIALIRAVCHIIKMIKRLQPSGASQSQILLQWLTTTMADRKVSGGQPLMVPKAVKWRVKFVYFDVIRNLIGVFGVGTGGVCEILKSRFMDAWSDENWQVGNSNVQNLKDVIASFPLVFLEGLVRSLKEIIERVNGKESYLTKLNAYYGIGQIIIDVKLAKNLSANEIESVKDSAWDILVKPLESKTQDRPVPPNTQIVILKCLGKICENSSTLNGLRSDKKANVSRTVTTLSKNEDPDVQKFASDLLHRLPK